MNTAKRQIAVGMLFGLVVVGLVGCGNKGPLYLPAPPPPEVVPVPVDTPPESDVPATTGDDGR